MEIGNLIREVSGRPPLSLDPRFALNDIEGWDSLAMVRLMIRLEEHLGRELGEAELGSLATIGDVERLLSAR